MLCVSVFACTFTSVPHMCVVPAEIKSEPPHRYWEANSGPLPEQQALIQCSLVPSVVNCVCPCVCVPLYLCVSGFSLHDNCHIEQGSLLCAGRCWGTDYPPWTWISAAGQGGQAV